VGSNDRTNLRTEELICPDPAVMSRSQYDAEAVVRRLYVGHCEMEQACAKIYLMIEHSKLELMDRDDSNNYTAYNNLTRALFWFGN
jgi:hypothetical protein